MSNNYFDPLPEEAANNFDGLLLWLGQQTVSFQKIITGALQVGNVLSSAIFVSGTSGWQIDGDGNAEFNDIIVRGDIESGNWDGTSPANLATKDGGATVGYYLDGSVGAAQFMGDLFIDGDIDFGGEMTGGTITAGLYRTAASGERLEIDGSTGNAFIEIYNSGGTLVGQMGWEPTGFGSELMVFSTEGGLDGIVIEADGSIVLSAGGSGADTVVVRGTGVGVPATVFSVQNLAGSTEYLRVNDNAQAAGANGSIGSPFWSFISDLDTGVTRVSANVLGLVAGGDDHVRISSASPYVNIDPDNGDNNIVLGLLIERTWSFRQRSTGASTGMDFETSSNKALYITGVSNGDMFAVTAPSNDASSLQVYDGLTDVGSQEILRINKGTGTTLVAIGYASSRVVDEVTGRSLKVDLKSLNDSHHAAHSKYGPDSFNLDWIDHITPIFFQKTATIEALGAVDGKGGWEMGVALEELAGVSPYLTTKAGEQVGWSPDETAMTALLVATVQDLRQRVAELEVKI